VACTHHHHHHDDTSFVSANTLQQPFLRFLCDVVDNLYCGMMFIIEHTA